MFEEYVKMCTPTDSICESGSEKYILISNEQTNERKPRRFWKSDVYEVVERDTC